MRYIKLVTLVVSCIMFSSVFGHHGFWDRTKKIQRKLNAENVRITAATADAYKTKLAHLKTNGDLERYTDKRGSYSKALAHKMSNGMVFHASFKSMVHALKTGKSSDFNAIILGTPMLGGLRLQDPQAAYAYTFEGADAVAYGIPPAPQLTSSQAAGEMVELYWGALLRDVPFNQYASNPTAVMAIGDLNSLSNFKGPKIGGVVTPQTLWRTGFPGVLDGPYISQFLYQPIPFHGVLVDQRYFSYIPGTANNFLTDVAGPTGLRLVENGGSTGLLNTFQNFPNFIFTGRDLGTYIHQDYTTQAWVNAALILLSYGSLALDINNPYFNNPTQDGFVTYGQSKVIELVNTASQAALKAAWYQKWMVHLRLRPENFGFLVQEQIVNGAAFGLNNQLINSPVLPAMFALYGTYLLPQMYPEGCPTSPSYPAEHAVIAGACATILKAFFNEAFEFSSLNNNAPLQPNSGNTGLELYTTGPTLFVAGELNKLASNIALAADWAGINYRSDCIEAMKLGEKIALAVLTDEGYSNNETFIGYTVTKFNGNTVLVGKKVTV